MYWSPLSPSLPQASSIFLPCFTLCHLEYFWAKIKPGSGKDWGRRSCDRGCMEQFGLWEPRRAVLCTAPSASAKAPGRTHSPSKWVFFKSFFLPMTFESWSQKKAKTFLAHLGLGWTNTAQPYSPALGLWGEKGYPSHVPYIHVGKGTSNACKALMTLLVDAGFWNRTFETGNEVKRGRNL